MAGRKGLVTIFVVIFTLGIVVSGYGDAIGGTVDVNINVDALALIAVSGSEVTFTVGGTPDPGDLPEVDDTGNVPTYLQYTSIVPAIETRTISVEPGAALPAGLKLNIRAGTPTGHGGVGTPVAGGIIIDSTWTAGSFTIIEGITSCATGSGLTQGPAVYYTLSIDESTFEDLDTTTTTQTVIITFTLVGS